MLKIVFLASSSFQLVQLGSSPRVTSALETLTSPRARARGRRLILLGGVVLAIEVDHIAGRRQGQAQGAHLAEARPVEPELGVGGWVVGSGLQGGELVVSWWMVVGWRIDDEKWWIWFM